MEKKKDIRVIAEGGSFDITNALQGYSRGCCRCFAIIFASLMFVKRGLLSIASALARILRLPPLSASKSLPQRGDYCSNATMMLDKLRLGKVVLCCALILDIQITAAQESTDLLIAVVGPMTGPSKHLGAAMSDAVQLKVDEVNASGGINGRKLRVLSFDDQNKAELAAQRAEEIAKTSGAYIVIGHRSSGSSIAAGPTYKAYGIPAITATATAEAVTRGNQWYFRNTYDNALQAGFIANYMHAILKYKHATLISSDDPYSVSLAKAFRAAVDKLPIKLAHEYTVKVDEADLDIEMLGIVSQLSLLPDSGIVFLALQAREAAHFVREMRNSGFKFPVFGADSLNESFPSYFQEDEAPGISAGDFTDGIFSTTLMIWDVAGADGLHFQSAFQKRFKRDPDGSSAAYYDATSVAIEAIKASVTGDDLATDRKEIRDYLSGINSFDKAFQGITGTAYFNDEGSAIRTVPIAVFHKDSFVSAPVQMEPVIDPVRVPDFAGKRETGEIIPYQAGYAHATQVVYVGIDVNEFSNLDTASGNYTLDFYIWFRYRGDLDLDDIDFSNAVGNVNLGEPIWNRERQGMVVATYKVRGLFHNQFEFQSYPFDKQQILLALRHRNRTRESLTFVIDRIGMRLKGKDTSLFQRIRAKNIFRTTPGWAMTNAVVYQDLVKTESTLGETVFFEGEAEINYSRLNMIIDITRNLSSYSTTILLPLAVLFIIAFMIYMIPVSEIAARVSAGVLVLVTVSLLRGRLSNDLPNIGYLVAIDYVFFVFQIIMVLGIFVTIASFWYLRNDNPQQARKANIYGAMVHPIPMVVVIFVLWLGLL